MSAPDLWQVSVNAEKDKVLAAADVVEQHFTLAPLSISTHGAENVLWSLDMIYDGKPNLDALKELLADLELTCDRVPDENWVEKSLEGLQPIRAGRFFVFGAHDAEKVPPGATSIRIEAGEAFGTGHHGTTAGCLQALDTLARQMSPDRVLDLGTGSGILAIAAAKLWDTGAILATDIDPIAVKVAHENANQNGVGRSVRSLTAVGTTHAGIHEAAPYDLVIANILAKPLRQLAGDIAHVLAPGGVLILSGILSEQAARVEAVYRGHHIQSQMRLTNGNWVTLIARKA